MDMETVKEYKQGNQILRVVLDDSPENPREWDNLGTMVCFHKRYILGDEHNYKTENFSSWNELQEQIIIDHDPVVILPLYLYDHSGITMNTTGFSCPWDSMRVGFIFAPKAVVQKEWNVEHVDKKLIDKVEKILLDEVETYDTYIRGDVYGFQLIEKQKCSLGEYHEKITDSCYGFFGCDIQKNGILDHIDKKWQEVVEKG